MGHFLCADYREAKQARLGITASRRFGNAPERNRFKRLVREAFRQNRSILPSLEIHVIPRQMAKKAKLHHIAEELLSVCR